MLVSRVEDLADSPATVILVPYSGWHPIFHARPNGEQFGMRPELGIAGLRHLGPVAILVFKVAQSR